MYTCIPITQKFPFLSLKPSLTVLFADKTDTPEKNDEFVGVFSRIQAQKNQRNKNKYSG